MPHTDHASDNQALAAFLKNRPEFEASGVTDEDSVWARFTDGRLLLVVNNRYAAPAAQRSADIPTASTAAADARRAIPAVTKAYAVSAMGAGFQDSASAVAGGLLSKGYNVSAGAVPVSRLKQVQQAGVFYIDTHGGKGPRRDGAEVYSLGTSEPATPEGDEAYKDDLDAGRLVYMICPWHIDAGGNGPAEAHYGFTKAFVTTYMDLPPNSLVYVDACSSLDQGMIEAFQSKGAVTYFGWTRPTADIDAYNTARYFFDRVLGANLVDPSADPPQRPFDIASVYADLQAHDLDRSLPPGQIVSKLKYVTSGGDAAVDLLAPTITRLQPEEETDTLHIAGSFGPDPGSEGKVTVDGVALKVQSWKKDQIACDLPLSDDDAKGSSGPVVVEVRGHKSNSVELTSWRPTFTFTYHGLGTMQYSMTIHAHIRADAHDYRFVPSERPRQGDWPFTLARDSKVTIAASGSYTDQVGNKYSLRINPAAPEIELNGPNTGTFSGSGTIETELIGGMRIMHEVLDGTVHDALETTVRLIDCTTITTLDEIRLSTASMADGTHSDIPVGLDPNYGTMGGTHAGNPEFEWDTVAAVHPPDPKAARSPTRRASRDRWMVSASPPIAGGRRRSLPLLENRRFHATYTVILTLLSQRRSIVAIPVICSRGSSRS